MKGSAATARAHHAAHSHVTCLLHSVAETVMLEGGYEFLSYLWCMMPHGLKEWATALQNSVTASEVAGRPKAIHVRCSTTTLTTKLVATMEDHE